MINERQLNEVLKNVNNILAAYDDRIQALEKKVEELTKPTTRSASKKP